MSTVEQAANPAAVNPNVESAAPPPAPTPVKGKLKEIPLRSIRESKVALRDVDREDPAYLELVDSVRNRGVLNPILVREIGKENNETIYSLVDGLQRFTASGDAGRETVPAQILDMEDGEVLEAQIIANAIRVETKHFQYSKQLQKILAQNPFMTMSELAGRLNKTPSWLSDRLSLNRLAENIGSLVDEGKINLTNGYILSKLEKDEQANFVERAMTLQPGEFIPQVNARVKELKEAKRQGRDPNTEQFIPQPHLQKIPTIKAELERPTALLALIEAAKPKTPVDTAKLVLSWVLHLDPQSVQAARTKYEEKKKSDAAAKEERDKERISRKHREAAETVRKLQQEAQDKGIPLDANGAAAT